jgi:hypothetical protein
MTPIRGEVWLFDLGMAEKVPTRPGDTKAKPEPTEVAEAWRDRV